MPSLRKKGWTMKGELYYKGMVLEERQIEARGDFCAYIEEERGWRREGLCCKIDQKL